MQFSNSVPKCASTAAQRHLKSWCIVSLNLFLYVMASSYFFCSYDEIFLHFLVASPVVGNRCPILAGSMYKLTILPFTLFSALQRSG